MTSPARVAPGMAARRPIGTTGIQVAPIGFGCMGMSWAYAGRTDEQDAVALIHRAVERGVTLLDTADVYGPFTNEELVGRAIAGLRDEVLVSTKCGFVAGESINDMRRDGTPAHIRAACEGSLRRLGIEVIDLYHLHRIDPAVPVEESVGAMAELVAEGKVRALGLSEVSVGELERAGAVHPIAAVQMELSLWTREPLDELAPWCAAHGVTLVAFSPLGRGFLAGKIRSVDDLAQDDWRRTLPRFQQDALCANLQLADRVRAVGERHGATAGQVALAWVLAQGEHVVPIPGTKRVGYLDENVAAAELRLTQADLDELSALPGAAGDRYERGQFTAAAKDA